MFKNVALVLASLAIFLAGGEAALWLYDLAEGRSPLHVPRVKPYRIFGPDLYRFENGRLLIQSRHREAFSFEKGADTLRIVTFGGSTTVNKTVYEDRGLHYPLLLQRFLEARLPGRRIEVINVANEAYATTHSLTILAFDVLSWGPDLVILSHNFNDLTASYLPGFLPDYSHKFAHDYYTPGLDEFLWKRSRFYRFVDARLRRLRHYPVRRQSYGPAPPPFAAAIFERNLRSFVTLAQANGTEVVLGAQPLARTTEDAFDAAMANKPYNRETIYPTHEEFLGHHRAFNAILERVAKATGSLFVDNDRAFAGDPALFSDFLHYTEAGVRRLAENYAAAILDADLLPRSSQLSSREPTTSPVPR